MIHLCRPGKCVHHSRNLHQKVLCACVYVCITSALPSAKCGDMTPRNNEQQQPGWLVDYVENSCRYSPSASEIVPGPAARVVEAQVRQDSLLGNSQFYLYTTKGVNSLAQ
jgi:hypothetical protein